MSKWPRSKISNVLSRLQFDPGWFAYYLLLLFLSYVEFPWSLQKRLAPETQQPGLHSRFDKNRWESLGLWFDRIFKRFIEKSIYFRSVWCALFISRGLKATPWGKVQNPAFQDTGVGDLLLVVSSLNEARCRWRGQWTYSTACTRVRKRIKREIDWQWYRLPNEHSYANEASYKVVIWSP